MKATPNLELATTCINRARGILGGKIDLPAVHYDGDRTGIHLSDLTSCPASAYYQKILGKDVPPNSDTNILHFVKGRGLERFFAEEQEGIIVDDISCTADGFYPEHGYLEIKTTAEQMDFFDPLTAHPEWIERILGYCTAYNQTYWNLVVFFLVGNMPNRLWWNIKEFGKSTEPYVGIALKAWRLSFSEAEITENWDMILVRKLKLEACIKNNTPPSKEWIDNVVQEWQHKICRFKNTCIYLHKNDGNYEPLNCHWITQSENTIKSNKKRGEKNG